MHSDKSWNIMCTILHISIAGLTDELANFINIFITSIAIVFIKHTESLTQLLFAPELEHGFSSKVQFAFIRASFNQTILWSI